MNDQAEPKPEGTAPTGSGIDAVERLPLEERAEAYAALLDRLRTELEADGRQ